MNAFIDCNAVDSIAHILEGQMSDQHKKWSDIYQFFSDNGRRKIFHGLFHISQMYFGWS
jgi:hypothetical protein